MNTSQGKSGWETQYTNRKGVYNGTIGTPERLLHSSNINPCPICKRTKDKDCSFTIDNALVNCHTEAKNSPRQFVNGYHFTGKFCDSGLHGFNSAAIYVKETDRSSKSIRPRQIIEFIYHDANGIAVVKVIRSDDGNGRRKFYQKSCEHHKWINSVPDSIHHRIHLYRIFEPLNQKALVEHIPILIVEGEGKVDLLLRMGIPATCSLGGAGKWRKYGYTNYLKDLEGASVVICPDRDQLGMKHAEDIARDFSEAQWLYAFPDSPEWNNLPAKAGLDIADWIAAGRLSTDDVLAAIGTRRPGAAESESTTDADEVHRLVRDHRLIDGMFGGKLRYNTLFNQIELNGEVFDPNMAKLEYVLTHKLPVKSCREDIADLTMRLAKQNAYSPVVEYLDRVHRRHGRDTSILDGLVQQHLGSNASIHQTLLRKFLISAVARAYQPGCKVDCALILQGRQGYGKSTFFRILASEAWFDDSLGSISEKDEKLKLHRAWFIEWAELETVFRRKDMSQVKAFLSSAIDLVRPPYGRSIETMKRASVIVGTTNQQQFLSDTTGNRRFWVIPTDHPIDRVRLQQERDRIWAAAVALYQAGEQWWLTDEQEETLNQDRERYESSDVWLEPVEEYLTYRDSVTIAEILKQAIYLDRDRHDKSAQNRVRDILVQLGWKAPLDRTSRHGVVGRYWTK